MTNSQELKDQLSEYTQQLVETLKNNVLITKLQTEAKELVKRK